MDIINKNMLYTDNKKTPPRQESYIDIHIPKRSNSGVYFLSAEDFS